MSMGETMTAPAIITLLVFMAAFGPWLTPYDFLSQDQTARNAPPSWAHWFGTDDLGRDVLGGWSDRVIMWFTDITMSIPNLLLVVVINASLKPPLANWMEERYLETLNPFYRNAIWIDFVLVFGSMALISWPPYARIVRAQVLSIRSRPYVTAARALGLTNAIILRRYIVPNALGPLIVAVSAGLGTAMVLESAFSFLGVGVNPPVPSWGNMISDGLRVWQHYPHLLAAPAAVLGIATVAFSFLGDGLNDALNPRGMA
jgi:ABC-type dipeptide/oligopeptide/nickel transport system permease subunit